MDIYFDKKYGMLSRHTEGGDPVYIDFSTENGSIKYSFIKRKIGETEYFDIITPYGYGGPFVESATNKEKLISQFGEYMKQYYLDNKIVSEFIRFHPLKKNAVDFIGLYNVEKIRKTLLTVVDEDPIQSQFSKSCRKKIRQVLNKGVSFEVIERPEDISGFKKIYYSTMDRNEASEFYYFDDDYFSDCLEYFKENLILINAKYDEQIIASGLYFVSGDTVHIHLSGTLNEYLNLSPAYVLRYAATLWAKDNGYKYIHHGGGRSNSSEDTLFLFKKQFATQHELDFCIGKKICNQMVYDELCEKNRNADEDFFPAYR